MEGGGGVGVRFWIIGSRLIGLWRPPDGLSDYGVPLHVSFQAVIGFGSVDLAA